MNNSLKEVPASLITGVKYYDTYASPGLMMGITEGTNMPDAAIQVPGLNDCDIAINVYGDSMYPKICSGEIVVCKETPIDSRLSYLRYGEADDLLTFQSENTHFKPYQVHKSRIHKLYLVKGGITRQNF